jgi:formylglycine-generating enzyme required for sulfatase activity
MVPGKRICASAADSNGCNFRILTEIEWEYAARGGNSDKPYKYSGSDNIDDVAWYNASSGAQNIKWVQRQPTI